MGNDFIGGPFGGMVSRVRHRVASVISQSQLALPVAAAGAVGMETTGCAAGRAEPAGLLPSAVAAGLPSGTGIPDRASGYDEELDEPEPDRAGGAFCAPRTDDGEPGGSVQLAWVFTGGRWVLWSGPIRWVPP